MRKLALTAAIACLSTVAVAAGSSSTGAQGSSPGTTGTTGATGTTGNMGATGTTGNMGTAGGAGHGGTAGSSGNMGTAGGGNMGTAGATGATGASAAAGVTTGPTSSIGKPAPRGAGDVYLATEFWSKNARDGHLSKEDAARFKGSDGSTVNFQRLDMNSDGRVSEREWKTYHEAAGAAGARPGGNQGQSTNR